MNDTRRIQTENMMVSLDDCTRLDRLVYQSKSPAPSAIIQKHAVIVAELRDKLTELNPEIAKSCGTSAAQLWGWIDRIQKDHYDHLAERMRANADTAHNQLKNWK